MSGFDYSRSKETADRLIARFGQDGYLIEPVSSGSYNPTIGTPLRHAAKMAVVDFAAREIDGTRVLARDKKIVVAKGDIPIDPTPAFKVETADGTQYTIVPDGVKIVKPAGVVLVYILQARR